MITDLSFTAQAFLAVSPAVAALAILRARALLAGPRGQGGGRGQGGRGPDGRAGRGQDGRGAGRRKPAAQAGGALERLRGQHARLAAALGAGHPRTLDAEQALAGEFLALGLPAEAAGLFRHAIGARSEATAADPGPLASARRGLAAALSAQGEAGEAAALWREIHSGLERSPGRGSLEELLARKDLAAALLEAGPPDPEPVRLCEGAAEGLESLLGRDDERAIEARELLARSLEGRRARLWNGSRWREGTALLGPEGRPGLERALPLRREALARCSGRLGPLHRRTLEAGWHLGRLLLGLGEPAAAAEELRRTVSGAERAFGRRDRRTLEWKGELAAALRQAGDFLGARTAYADAVKGLAEAGGPQGAVTVALEGLAGCLMEAQRGEPGTREYLEDMALARDAFRELLPRHMAEDGPRSVPALLDRAVLGSVLNALGGHAEAAPLFEEALAGAAGRADIPPRLILEWKAGLGDSRLGLGESGRARELYREVAEAAGAAAGPDSGLADAARVRYADFLVGQAAGAGAALPAEAGPARPADAVGPQAAEDLAAARDLYRDVLEGVLRGPDAVPPVARLCNRLAPVLRCLGEEAEAVRILDAARARLGELPGPGPAAGGGRDRGRYIEDLKRLLEASELSRAYLAAGAEGQARVLIAATLAGFGGLLGRERPEALAAALPMARTTLTLGYPAEAEPLYARICEVLEEGEGPDPGDRRYPEALLGRAEACAALGLRAEARALLEKASSAVTRLHAAAGGAAASGAGGEGELAGGIREALARLDEGDAGGPGRGAPPA